MSLAQLLLVRPAASRGLASLLGDAVVQLRRQLADRATVDPSILPEEGFAAVPYLHGSRGKEPRTLVGRQLQVQSVRLISLRGAQRPTGFP